MRVAILTPSLGSGGAERVSSVLANGLTEQGDKVTVVCVYADNQDYPIHPEVGIISAVSDRKTALGFLDRNIQISKIIKKLEPDVVISFVLGDAILTELHHIPVVQTLRNDPWNDNIKVYHNILRKIAYILANKIIFQTAGAARYFPSEIANKGVILPNPIEVDSMPTWHRNMGCKTIIAAGRLVPQKNYRLLIDAFHIFHKDHQDYKLKIFGEGPLKNEIKNQINYYRLTDSVELKGNSSQIFEQMAKASVFVLASDYEGVSNAMLEALCIGMPCVITDHSPGGAREYITDGYNGLLTEVRNAEMMAYKLSILAEDWNTAYTIADHAIETRKLVSSKRVVKLWKKIIS